MVTAHGEIDLYTVPRFREACREALAMALDGAGRHVVIDLSDVRFMDSSGLGVIVGCFKRTRSEDVRLSVLVTRDQLIRELSVTGLDRVFLVAQRWEEIPDTLMPEPMSASSRGGRRSRHP